LEDAVEKEQPGKILFAKRALEAKQWTLQSLDEKEREIRKRQSEERGVSLAYLVSSDFEDLARHASGLDDPTFNDLKWPFFLGPNALGRDKICPRDGMKGCALVDVLPCHMRGKATHFLSWTWASKVSTVGGALVRWTHTTRLEATDVVFYMCFFVNNQYRILIPGSNCTGSDNLEIAFESSLRRIGKVVTVLDTFDRPIYLTRIWTIFEQFTAMRLGINVEMTLPPDASSCLIREFEKGKDGIMRVRSSMTTVDSSSARASDSADESKVKNMIEDSVGFEEVDNAIRHVMIAWVASELSNHMSELVRGDDTYSEGGEFGYRGSIFEELSRE